MILPERLAHMGPRQRTYCSSLVSSDGRAKDSAQGGWEIRSVGPLLGRGLGEGLQKTEQRHPMPTGLWVRERPVRHLLTFNAFLAASAPARLSKITKPTG